MTDHSEQINSDKKRIMEKYYKKKVTLPPIGYRFLTYLANMINTFSQTIPISEYNDETIEKIAERKFSYEKNETKYHKPERTRLLILIISEYIKDPNDERFKDTVDSIISNRPYTITNFASIFPFQRLSLPISMNIDPIFYKIPNSEIERMNIAIIKHYFNMIKSLVIKRDKSDMNQTKPKLKYYDELQEIFRLLKIYDYNKAISLFSNIFGRIDPSKINILSSNHQKSRDSDMSRIYIKEKPIVKSSKYTKSISKKNTNTILPNKYNLPVYKKAKVQQNISLQSSILKNSFRVYDSKNNILNGDNWTLQLPVLNIPDPQYYNHVNYTRKIKSKNLNNRRNDKMMQFTQQNIETSYPIVNQNEKETEPNLSDFQTSEYDELFPREQSTTWPGQSSATWPGEPSATWPGQSSATWTGEPSTTWTGEPSATWPGEPSPTWTGEPTMNLPENSDAGFIYSNKINPSLFRISSNKSIVNPNRISNTFLQRYNERLSNNNDYIAVLTSGSNKKNNGLQSNSNKNLYKDTDENFNVNKYLSFNN